MIPTAELALEKWYLDQNGLTIGIQVSEKGWCVLWADHGSESKKEFPGTDEDRLNDAVEYVESKGFALTDKEEGTLKEFHAHETLGIRCGSDDEAKRLREATSGIQPVFDKDNPHIEDLRKFGQGDLSEDEKRRFIAEGPFPDKDEVYTEQLEEPKERDPREKCRQCQGHGHLLGMPSQSCSHCAGTGFTSLDFDEDDKVVRYVMNKMERKCPKCGGNKVCNKGHPYKEFECDHCDGSGTRIEKASLAEVVDMIEEAMNDPEATHVKRTS